MVIPHSVITYGEYIFSGCEDLSTVTFNSLSETYNVTAIPVGMFKGCIKLHDLYFFENGVKLDQGVFAKTLKTIGAEAFMNTKMANPSNETANTKLHDFVLPEGLETIGDYAFKNSDLVEITLPSTLSYTGIGKDIFMGSLIVSAYFKGTFTRIPAGILEDVKSLKNIYFYENGDYLNANTLPSTLKEIGQRAFKNTGLESIVFNSQIEKIEDYAFAETELVEVVLPDSISAALARVEGFCQNPEK